MKHILSNYFFLQLHSEYRSTYRWHEYTPRQQQVVSRPPQPLHGAGDGGDGGDDDDGGDQQAAPITSRSRSSFYAYVDLAVIVVMFLAFVAAPTSSWSRCRSRHSYCFVDFRQQRSYRFWVAPPPLRTKIIESI